MMNLYLLGQFTQQRAAALSATRYEYSLHMHSVYYITDWIAMEMHGVAEAEMEFTSQRMVNDVWQAIYGDIHARLIQLASMYRESTYDAEVKAISGINLDVERGFRSLLGELEALRHKPRNITVTFREVKPATTTEE